MQNSDSTISTWASAIARTLARHYLVDPKPVFADIGIEFSRLNEPEYRVPVVLMTQLWRHAVLLSQDACFGLEVARYVSPTTFNALGYAAMASRNVQEAIFRIIQNANSVSGVAQLSLQGQKEGMFLRFDLRDDSPEVATEAMEAFMGSIIHISRNYMHIDPPLQRVYLKREAPAESHRYSDFFGTPVVFNAECNALVSSVESIMSILPTHNSTLAEANDKVLERWRQRVKKPDLKWQVMEAIDRLLPDEPKQEQVALCLNVSVRTLQRKLDAEGTSFQNLLDTTRKNLAERWLLERKMNIQQIADALGFANPSAFTRAFKRWAGCSPEQFRSLGGSL